MLDEAQTAPQAEFEACRDAPPTASRHPDPGEAPKSPRVDYATELRSIVRDASMMSHDLTALAYLFQKALVADAEADSDLLKASYLVVDVMKTIAARLAATDERAALAYARAKL